MVRVWCCAYAACRREIRGLQQDIVCDKLGVVQTSKQLTLYTPSPSPLLTPHEPPRGGAAGKSARRPSVDNFAHPLASTRSMSVRGVVPVGADAAYATMGGSSARVREAEMQRAMILQVW